MPLKTEDIAKKYNIDKTEFENFLLENNLKFSKGLLSGIVVNDANVSNYAEMFKKHQAEMARRRAEEEAKRKAEEEAKHKAEEEARRKTEDEARRKAEEEAKRKAIEEAERVKKIQQVEEEFLKAEELEQQSLKGL